jgi:hypothetical protein
VNTQFPLKIKRNDSGDWVRLLVHEDIYEPFSTLTGLLRRGVRIKLLHNRFESLIAAIENVLFNQSDVALDILTKTLFTIAIAKVVSGAVSLGEYIIEDLP